MRMSTVGGDVCYRRESGPDAANDRMAAFDPEQTCLQS